ncbi:MAG: hypothetical protein JWR67_2821, partial [Mucilaginibacter sp.]|nr:hypothetical protein [Mucilaginibacter sp.]
FSMVKDNYLARQIVELKMEDREVTIRLQIFYHPNSAGSMTGVT